MPMIYNLSYLNFWKNHPALFYGISFLLGLYCYWTGSLFLVIPFLSLWFPLVYVSISQKDWNPLKFLALSGIIACTAWFYAATHYSFPSLPANGIQGDALINIHQISFQQSLFGKRWLYRCEIKHFIALNPPLQINSSIPCLIILSEAQVQRHSRPLANQDYWINGRLVQTAQESYVLKISAKTSWIPIEDTWSPAELRYAWKKSVNQWIQEHISNPMSGSFLSGLATGEFDDNWMRQQFARFGLQHLLAISGFHFAITAGFLSFVLGIFLSRRMGTMTLLICLGGYCLFLGPQASVLRAWIMCSLALAGLLLEKKTNALNSLGVALLIVLGWDPLLSLSLGFQLSFVTTAAILLFFHPAQALLGELLPKRPLKEVIDMNHWNQHGYCLLAFLRGALALTLAVNSFALPFTLYYFNQFPWMSLLYNLFFPFLASVSMCLLLLGGLFSFAPFISDTIHHLNSVYTDFLLRLTYQVPSGIDTALEVEKFDPVWLIVYVCAASLLGIWWRERANLEDEGFTMI